MSMAKKIMFVLIIIGATIGSYFFLWAIHPLIVSSSNIAATGPGAANMTGFVPGVSSFPLWGMFIPALVALVAIVLVLRTPEKQ